jgi:hypothetical protein
MTAISAGTVLLYYGVTVSGIACGASTPFTVYPLPTVTITSGVSAPLWMPLVFCGNTLPLTASGAFSYTWSPATYLSTTVLPTTVISGLIATTTYTVTGTDINGCRGYATEKI